MRLNVRHVLLGHHGQQLAHRLDLRYLSPSVVSGKRAPYPDLTVRVNGQEVTPFETYDRFLDLTLDPGEHHIELRASLSPLRPLLIGISIALFLLGVSLSRREIRDHRPQ